MKSRTLLALVLAAGAVVGVAGPVLQAQTFCVPPSKPPAPPPPDDPPTVCEPKKCNSCYFSPCHVGLGIYVQEFTDYSVETASFPLEVSRRYMSSRMVDGPNGIGWTSSLVPRLYHAAYLFTAPSAYSYEVRIMLTDGVVYRYTSAGGSNFTPPASRRDKLVRNTDGTFDLTLEYTNDVLHFDATGAAQTLTDDYGNQIGYVYDGQGRLLKIEDRSGSGRYLDVVWGSDGRIASVTARAVSSPSSPTKTVQYTYNADGTLATDTDPVGRVTTYAYTAGRFAPLLQTIHDHWNRQITRLTFDSAERLSSYTDGDPAWGGETFTYTYFPQNSLTMKASSTGSVAHSYTSNGIAMNISQFRDVTTGRVYFDTNNGFPISYQYDGQGRLTVESVSAGTNSVAWKYTYDTNYPDKIAGVEPYTNTSLNTRNADYQALYPVYYGPSETGHGRLKRIEALRKDGTTRDTLWRYVYDSKGRITSKEEVGASQPRTYSYDAAGNLQSVTHNGTITYGYDALGRMTSMTDKMGAVTTYEYDALDRVTSVTLPAPYTNAPLFKTTYSYDNYDATKRLVYTHTTDPNGRIFKNGFDVMGNKTEDIDRAGNISKYTYTNNLLSEITDANGNKTSYTYTADGRLLRTTHPDGTYEELSYNSADAIATKRDRAGVTFVYTYDSQERLVRASWNNLQRWVEWTYTGDILTQTRYFGGTAWDTTDYTYDSQYRLLTEKQHNRGKLTFAYVSGNPSNRLSQLTVESEAGVPGSPMVTNYTAYDAGGRLTQMHWGGGNYFIAYNANDQYTSVSDSYGHVREMQYDGQGRLTNLANKRNGVTLAAFAYGYDDNWSTGTKTMLGQRTSVNITATSALSQNTGLTKYFYDANYQLTQAEYGGLANTWTYDAIGNRLTATTSTYRYYPNALGNNTSRLKNLNGSSSIMTYDSRGNLATDASANVEYVYDDLSRLLKRKNLGTGAGIGSWFEYDALARRAVRETASEKFAVLNHGEHAVSERRMSSQIGRTDQVDYLFGPGIDEPLAVKSQDGLSFYLIDGNGSVIAKDSTTFDLTEATGYLSFGQPTVQWPSYFGYTGRESVDGTLWYYRSRYYNPQRGRFLTEDPSGFDGGINKYAYVFNNPVNMTDPDGLKPKTYNPYKKCLGDALEECEGSFKTICKWFGKYKGAALDKLVVKCIATSKTACKVVPNTEVPKADTKKYDKTIDKYKEKCEKACPPKDLTCKQMLDCVAKVTP